eukprot:522332-Prorocentrum_minimum.AAC.1
MGSDGLFDNLFDEELAEIVRVQVVDPAAPNPDNLSAAARRLVEEARERSHDPECLTPFSEKLTRIEQVEGAPHPHHTPSTPPPHPLPAPFRRSQRW